LVSCLLSAKSQIHYRHVLQSLKNRVRQKTHHNFKPSRVICDFEMALMAAVELELPFSKLCGCLFHFRQSLYRKVTDLGLKREYKNDINLKSMIAKFMSMGVIPLPHVRNCYTNLVNGRQFSRAARQYPELNRFAAYFDNTYMHVTFKPRMWNVHDRNRRNRTNNFVEGKIQLVPRACNTKKLGFMRRELLVVM